MNAVVDVLMKLWRLHNNIYELIIVAILEC